MIQNYQKKVLLIFPEFVDIKYHQKNLSLIFPKSLSKLLVSKI